MGTEVGMSIYFRANRIRFRNKLIQELGNPTYIHLFIDGKDKIMYVQTCDRDKDAFKMYYREDSNSENFYINAKVLMQYLAKVIGVPKDSVSLRFEGILLDEHTIMIALDEYEPIKNE